MKKVLFYCQHLLGIGHVTRSLAIVNELSRDFSVTYVQGGPAVALVPVAAVNLVQLDALLMKETDSSLYDPAGERSVDSIFLSRADQLAKLAATGFDAVVIELYPFGRKKFGPEILRFLGQLKAANPKIKVITSVRDILVEKGDGAERNRKIANVVNQNFDEVWVHSDPNLIKFGETFSEEKAILEKIRYTGFVAEPPKSEAGVRKKRIILSLGGGSVGEELYRVAAKTVSHFPDYDFLFVFGPYTSPALAAELKRELAGYSSRVEFSGLLKNFEQVLAESALSLSMAGYNTVMNLLNTKTPALVLAYGANHEQNMRASLLEAKGYLRVLSPDELQEEPLAALMKERLGAAYPASSPDLGGSRKCRELLGAAFSHS